MPLEAAVKAMTETPAKDIDVFDSIGSLETGKCADFLVLNKDLKLMATFIDGKLVNSDRFCVRKIKRYRVTQTNGDIL